MTINKLYRKLIFCLCCLFMAINIQAQDGGLRDRLARKQNQQQNSENNQLTIRSVLKNDAEKKAIDNAPWMREVYRFIDLDKEQNAALYYPVKPIGDRTNFFTLIFKQLLAGNINVYKWPLDGNEVFTNEYKESVKDLLESFDILYKEENGKYTVETVDVPSNEIKGYYIKEVWYFDINNSVVDRKTVAVCPILFRQDDFGVESTRYPMFWLPYDEIRPYASRMPIMTSDLNNASTQTINDYFLQGEFGGEIYKTTNFRDLSLAQMYPNEKDRKAAERKIEKQLTQFNDSLWVTNDSIIEARALARAIKTQKGKKSTGGSTTKGGSIETPNRASVQKEAREQKSSSPSKSMRNRRRN